jgi:Flp pilus assembly protein TadB
MRSSREPSARAGRAGPPSRDGSELRERRRVARRRQRLARIDLGLGAAGALVLLLATPGLAVTAVIALLVLALCALSVVVQRRRHKRSERGGSPARTGRGGGRPRADAPRGSGGNAAGDARRAQR